MTRRRVTLDQADAILEAQCLLCGKPAHVEEVTDTEVVVWDLCASCDGVFQLTAARVAAAVPLVITGTAAEALESVVGQLELDDSEAACPDCGGRYGACSGNHQ